MEDSLIIKYIKNKKEKGLELLIKNYGGLIKAIVRKHLSSISYYEEECFDDILISIWNNINSFNGQGSFKSWIGVISKFKAIDYKRKYLKLNTFENIDDIEISDSTNVSDEIILEELKLEVHSLIDNLKEDDKKIFIKYYLEDVKVDLIAKEMNLNKEVIYNKLSRGRRKLSNILSKVN